MGYMEDGKLVIVEGPLKGREDWVRKVNHRKRLAWKCRWEVAPCEPKQACK